MSLSASSATACIQDFIRAFNALDHEALAATLNFPHVRLANGKFTEVKDAASYIDISRKGEPHLIDQGWHHTDVQSIEVVQDGDEKVHIAMRILRCKEDGTPYLTFDTLWIVTLLDGHWGIQFRSSYLR